MAAQRTEAESALPVTVEELAERGLFVFRSGARAVRIVIVDDEGNKHSFSLPGPGAADAKAAERAEATAAEVKITEYLAKCTAPVSKTHLNKAMTGSSAKTGGRYGMAFSALHKAGKLFLIDGDVADDLKKFGPAE